MPTEIEYGWKYQIATALTEVDWLSRLFNMSLDILWDIYETKETEETRRDQRNKKRLEETKETRRS